MPVTGYVGLMGSGKTLRAVRLAMEARAMGREVYANFRLGHREWGYLRPTVLGGAPSVFEPWDVLRDPAKRRVFSKETGYRVGRGFVPEADTYLLRSWDDLVALRVLRDGLMVAHRDGCVQWSCGGCSKGITVVIDELNLWAPSRLWAELGVGVLNRWAYVRKDGLEIIWTAQHEARVDKVAREVTDAIWNCRKLGGMVGSVPLMVFHRTKYVPALMTEKNRTAAQEGASRAGIMAFEWSFFDREAAESFDTYEHVADSGHLADVVPMPVSARRPRSGRSAQVEYAIGRAVPRHGIPPVAVPYLAASHPQGRSAAEDRAAARLTAVVASSTGGDATQSTRREAVRAVVAPQGANAQASVQGRLHYRPLS